MTIEFAKQLLKEKQFPEKTSKTSRSHMVAICLDKSGNVLSYGYNSYEKTHPIQAMYAKRVGKYSYGYLHAEMSAILAAGNKQIHKIFVARIDRNGIIRCAKPCEACEAAINDFKIKQVEYTL